MKIKKQTATRINTGSASTHTHTHTHTHLKSLFWCCREGKDCFSTPNLREQKLWATSSRHRCCSITVTGYACVYTHTHTHTRSVRIYLHILKSNNFESLERRCSCSMVTKLSLWLNTFTQVLYFCPILGLLTITLWLHYLYLISFATSYFADYMLH